MKSKLLLCLGLALILALLPGCDLFRGPGTGIVEGTVKDSEGTTIEGVTVSIGTRTDTTDADGQYQLTEVPSGTQTIKAMKDEYATYEAAINVKRDEVITHNITMESIYASAREMIEAVRNTGVGMGEFAMSMADPEYWDYVMAEHLMEALIHSYELFFYSAMEFSFLAYFMVEDMDSGEYDVVWDPDEVELISMDWVDETEGDNQFIFNVNDMFRYDFSREGEMPGPLLEEEFTYLDVELTITMIGVDEALLPFELPPDFDYNNTLYDGKVTLTSNRPPDVMLSLDTISEYIDFEFNMSLNDDLMVEETIIQGFLHVEHTSTELENGDILGTEVEFQGYLLGPVIKVEGSFHFKTEDKWTDEEDYIDYQISSTGLAFWCPVGAVEGTVSAHVTRYYIEDVGAFTVPHALSLGQKVGFKVFDYDMESLDTEFPREVIFDPDEWDVVLMGEISFSSSYEEGDTSYEDIMPLIMTAEGMLKIPEMAPFTMEMNMEMPSEDAMNMAFWIEWGEEVLEGTFSYSHEGDIEVFHLKVENQYGYWLEMTFTYEDGEESFTGAIYDADDTKLATLIMDEATYGIWILWEDGTEEPLF